MDLKTKIRSVPDFPKEGINFFDITTLLCDPAAFRYSVDQMAEHFKNRKVDKIVSIESRGFIFGAALAYKLGCSFVPASKPGKLPYKTIKVDYSLEYGKDGLELHEDSICKGDRVMVIDDLLATGGTVEAVCKLVERLGGVVEGIGVLIELSFLPGRKKLEKYNIVSLVDYDSE